ncbi:hypothetical protein L228DRAFT_260432 [Xylona heveae TC161]|uniref:LysM domain-containing protein n=1 Tax=Xylona heveae (strain CBS 132557 / TC161) TaxID=1328760 RepID=A0A165HKF4_XYLHT|nr:hypothetical protein L228DRAFT_260432 [Xylona heveae TC161]KZF23645.1 hypothetical protein L228DRAFT_260432 [Xylona heveae TC161]
MTEACCTCATVLSPSRPFDKNTEKHYSRDRRLSCCGRVICSDCVYNNTRFATYCPFCQISTTPTPLPQGGLRDPPAYSPPAESHQGYDELPTYSSLNSEEVHFGGKNAALTARSSEDVLHFVDPEHDSIASLSLRYGVPQHALRRSNGLFADHLLAARRTILIPGEFYKGGVSLSPRPLEGEEEETRKGKIRRLMIACKITDYDIAVLYLKQSNYDLDAAANAFKADEDWERDHPITGVNAKGKSKQKSYRQNFRALGGSLANPLP